MRTKPITQLASGPWSYWLHLLIALSLAGGLTASAGATGKIVAATASTETPLAEPLEIIAPAFVAIDTPDGLTEIALPDDGVVVLFFYETERCPDCITIEATALDLLDVDFEQARLDSLIYWQDVDFMLPENSEFQEAYGLEETTIVLSRREAGVEIDWLVLGEIWDLVEDTLSLADYIRFEIEDFLSQTSE
jgi:hypothetical protein